MKNAILLQEKYCQWHDNEECRAASAAKNDAYKRTLQTAATRAIVGTTGRREGKTQEEGARRA